MRNPKRSRHCIIFALLVFQIQRNRRRVSIIERTGPAIRSGSHSPTKRRKVLRRDRHRCYLCGRWLEPAEAVLDHIIPRSRGGSNQIGNLGAAHPACDQFKGDRLLCELTWPG
jgi:5-methylcytosine-specific restriction endonuclease McrA